MLDFAFGSSRNLRAIDILVGAFEGQDLSGTLYLGYPLLTSLDGTQQLDALLTCEECGVVAFDLSSTRDDLVNNPEKVAEAQNDIWVSLNNKLSETKALRKGRGLAFKINVVTFLPDISGINEAELDDDINIASPATLKRKIESFEELPEDLVTHLNAAIQHTTTIKPIKKRTNVVKDDSKGQILKELEAKIANLDAWQKRGAIEYPEGPQRIRGLAGSGKTIVLAQKAAFLHAKYPDLRIAVTFQTRSLYQQFISLIRKFSFDLIRDEPDWEKLKVIHAWGSQSSPGVYSEISKAAGLIPQDFGAAKNRFGTSRAFQGVCKELNEKLQKSKIEQIFDAVLIDEAQDFPAEFFQMVYEATTPPKRIIWAYDELQNLSEFSMPPAEDLFGKNPNGEPKVRLRNEKGRPLQDIVLPVCYRNTPWALTMAHALGFGIYREDGLVQMFDDPSLWGLIGYEIDSGTIAAGTEVSLKRKNDASPSYFADLMTPNEAFKCHSFKSSDEEYEWVATAIQKNLEQDELDADDILIIESNPLNIRSTGAKLMKLLRDRNIPSHLAGITTSRDKLFYEKSVAITSIYRAKGNEAPIVYVVGAEHTYQGYELSKKRNILFTAITRSRAWVNVTGSGPLMNLLKNEIDQVKANEYQLIFTYPTKVDIEQLRRIHRDMSYDEKMLLENDLESLARIVERVKNGELDASTLPEDKRAIIERLIESAESNDA